MKKAPKIGQRVTYLSRALEEHEGEPRTCTGTVMAIYEHRDEDLKLSPEREWSAGVKVDQPLPKWWPYPGDRFAPDVAELSVLRGGK